MPNYNTYNTWLYTNYNITQGRIQIKLLTLLPKHFWVSTLWKLWKHMVQIAQNMKANWKSLSTGLSLSHREDIWKAGRWEDETYVWRMRYGRSIRKVEKLRWGHCCCGRWAGQVKQVLDYVKVCLLIVDVQFFTIFFKAGN